jgi:hypothetical protein
MNKLDHIDIINNDNLEAKYILDEIYQVEEEKGRRVVKAEFIDNGDGTATQRFWFQKRPGIERLRRLTGYLTGTLDKVNNAKQAEIRDRVTHTTSCECTEGK